MNKSETAKKGILGACVLGNEQIHPFYYRLDLQLDVKGSELFSNVVPGQFLELDLSGVSLPNISHIPDHLKDVSQRSVLLRRPFSFSNVTVTQDSGGTSVKVQILYCVLGPASVRMMNLRNNDTVSVLGPLGNGFSIPDGLSHAVLVAGGMGSPPILHLASYLKEHYPKCDATSFVGAKSSEDLPFTLSSDDPKGIVLEEFKKIDVPSHIATDDGSIGYRGFVTDCVCHWLEKNDIDLASTVVFACGPEPMLAATAALAENYELPCQVSMERMMACGIGLCQSCAVEAKTTENKYHLCCKDGPVFDARKVVF
ncbi:MAG: dihydroorotate dehydrogenase electron transfer subunit [Planctomycetota bacterium]